VLFRSQAAQESNPCVQVVNRDGKTFIEITNYDRVRTLFAKLLNEVQRITSEGDYDTARKLADDYGKKVDLTLHQEVLDRSEKLNIPPYNGFMNPLLVPVNDENGNIKDVQVTYMDSFAKQMLMYSEKFGFLR
jgi:dipeptidyl-peptidase-3